MVVTITVPYDPAALERLRAKFPDYIDKALMSATRRIQRMMREKTPSSGRPWEKIPGDLQRSAIAWQSRSAITMQWSQPYAKYVAEGTPAHAVLPKKGSLLHWQPQPGVWGHSKGHMVRGIRAQTLPTAEIMQLALDILVEELTTLAVLELDVGTGGTSATHRIAWRPPTQGGVF